MFAVNNISVTLQPGVYGLLGANGAGKTTLMRMVCDVLKPTSGRILYNGKEKDSIKYELLRGHFLKKFRRCPLFCVMEKIRHLL